MAGVHARMAGTGAEPRKGGALGLLGFRMLVLSPSLDLS